MHRENPGWPELADHLHQRPGLGLAGRVGAVTLALLEILRGEIPVQIHSTGIVAAPFEEAIGIQYRDHYQPMAGIKLRVELEVAEKSSKQRLSGRLVTMDDPEDEICRPAATCNLSGNLTTLNRAADDLRMKSPGRNANRRGRGTACKKKT
jgi:hypothetical protein